MELHDEVEEDSAHVLLFVVVGDHVCNGQDLVGPSSQWRVGNAQQLASDTDGKRR